MKKSLLILLLIPVLGFTQEKASLKVTGHALHVDKEPIFKGSVVLSAVFSSYPSEAINLEQLKIKYDEALKKNGLSIIMLVEKPDLYTHMGYEKEGTLYQYETSDLQDFQRFLSSTCFGLQRLNYDASFTINALETEKLISEAITNARTNASLLAKGASKKLGAIIGIEDTNRMNTEIRKGLYYNQEIAEHLYEIKVQFSLEN